MCERVIKCCVRAITLFLEIPWRVTLWDGVKVSAVACAADKYNIIVTVSSIFVMAQACGNM